MTLPSIVPPPEVSRQLAWEALKGIKPLLNSTLAELKTGYTAAQAKHFADLLGLQMTNLSRTVTEGLLDGDTSYKTIASNTLAELRTMAANLAGLQGKYERLVREKMATEAANGVMLSFEEAASQTIMDDVDINELAAQIRTLLGI